MADTEGLSRQKAFLCRALLRDEGKVRFSTYKTLTTKTSMSSEARISFFKRFFEQCFRKYQIDETFIFDFDKYWRSNIRKMEELPKDMALKLKFHFFLKGTK